MVQTAGEGITFNAAANRRKFKYKTIIAEAEMRKILKALALILLFSFIFCSCGEVAEETVPEYDLNVDAVNLEGLKLNWGWDAVEGDKIIGFIPNTANADRVLKRKSDIENKLNCSVNMVNSTNIYDIFRTGVLSGAQTLDFITGGSFALVVDVRAGYFSGLSSLIDTSDYEKWGTPNMLQSMIWKNDVFGVMPFAWPELAYGSAGHVICVNEDYISKLVQTDPREYVEKGDWNWDLFEECLAAYTHTDTRGTVYGIQCHAAYFAMNMLLSNGVALSEFEEGKVVCGAYTADGRAALERARQIFQVTSKDCFHPSQAAGDNTVFVNGECVTYVAWSFELSETTNSVMYNMDNVGIIPFPQGPNATPGIYLSYHENLSNTTGIPFNAKDPAISAMILSEMFEPFDDFPNKDSIVDYLADQVFYDRRDAEVLLNLVRNTEYGFFREGARGVIENATESDTSISKLLESYQSAYDKIAEDYMLPHYQGRIAVYGE